ncbi:Esterase [Leucoagaricus sp. SymC.cos]|nr:Esterase [Leucoagaricus sp. SymC.cos]
MTDQFNKQPLRTLFLTYQALSLRPRNSWDLKRAVLVNVIRHLFEVQSHAGPLRISPDHREITPGEGANGIWISPVPEKLIVGKLDQWAEFAGVSSIRIPGYWMHKSGIDLQVASAPQPGEKVILAFHGGAYIRLSAHPSDPTAEIARGLVKTVDSVQRVLSVEYRLSSSKPYPVANPFPAALLDALASYVYLVDVIGFSPSDIIVEGDSAGGNLAHALTRYLIEYKGTPGLPAPPGTLILLSPWIDLGQSHNHIPNGSASTCAVSDYLKSPAHSSFVYPVVSFVGPHGLEAAEINPYISPASLNPALVVDFKNFPRTFIVAGGAEVLLDSIRTLRDRMFKDLGEGNGVSDGEGRVRYFEAVDGFHDFLIFPWHQPEVRNTLHAIAEWVSLND